MAWTFHLLLPGMPAASPRGALGWCNVVLLQQDGFRMLFDTGSHGDRAPLLAALGDRNLAPGDIQAIFLSHFHYDHALNAEIFPQARLFLSRAEHGYARKGDKADAGRNGERHPAQPQGGDATDRREWNAGKNAQGVFHPTVSDKQQREHQQQRNGHDDEEPLLCSLQVLELPSQTRVVPIGKVHGLQAFPHSSDE